MKTTKLTAPYPIYRIETEFGESISISEEAIAVSDRDGDVASIEITDEIRAELIRILHLSAPRIRYID